MKFVRKKLGDITLNITDGEHNTVVDTIGTNYFLLSNKNIIDGQIKITKEDRTISKNVLDKIQKRTKIEFNDVIISTVGTIGKVAIIKDKNINYDFQRSVGIIKCDNTKILPEYLIYYLTTPFVQERLQKLSKGAIQKCLYINDLLDLDIDLPENVKDQYELIKSLVQIDNQISRNNDMVQKLQVLGQTIYSRSIKETKDFFKYDVNKITTGKQDANFATKDGQYKFFTCSEDSFLCDDYEFDGKNILIAGNGNFNVKFYDGKFNAYQRTYIIKDEKIFGNLYYTYSYNTQLFLKGSNGSIVKFITIGMIKDIDIPKFSNEINNILNNVVLEISTIKQNNEKLNNLKQTLLPLLINGQLEI